MTAWPLVPLAEVLTKSEEWIKLEPSKQYRQVTVKMWGQGIVERSVVLGQEIGSEKRLMVRADQFLISRIDARNGASGLVPCSLDGAVVSNDFPAFTVKSERLDARFFGWYSKTSKFVDDCKAASEGTTNRVRLKEDRFLRLTVALPSLGEQRRIVERIEQVWAAVSKIEVLQAETGNETLRLLAAEEIKVWPTDALADAPSLADVTEFLSRGRQSEQGLSEHFLIKTQHVQNRRYVRSTMTLAPHIAAKVSSESLAKSGDVLIACSAAGCLGRVAFFQEEQIASTDTHVAIARAKQDVVLPEYLYAYLRGAQGQFQLKSREQGDWKREKVSFRLTELNLADLRRVPVPMPGLVEQRRIVDYIEKFTAKINLLHEVQSRRAAEVAALRPSILNRAFSGEL